MNEELDPELQAERAQWINRKYIPEYTWIFKRGDGEVIMANENQAWEILHPRGNWQRRDFTLVGSSDFKRFAEILSEGEKETQELKSRLEIERNEVRRYENSYERMKYDDLLDDSHEKVIKVKAILSEKNRTIEKIKEEINGKKSEVHKRALKEEMEIAKGNTRLPQDQDFIAIGNDKQRVIEAFKKM
jgi:predicted transcriptional regulator